jgi:hypothetical protein
VAGSEITGISLRGVRELLADRQPGEAAFDAVDKLLDVVIALSPLALGPAALSLWTLFEPKAALMNAAKDVARRFTKAQPRDYLERARNMAAANCLLTYTAYFDALDHRIPDLMKELKLTEKDKQAIITRKNIANSEDPGLRVIAAPHPAGLADAERSARIGMYSEMGREFEDFLVRSPIWKRLTQSQRTTIRDALNEIPPRADELYFAEYAGMAVEFQPFFVWSVLEDRAARDALIRKVGEDVRTQFELIGSAVHGLDLGLCRLADAVRRLPAPTVTGQVPGPGVGAMAAVELHRAYADELGRPIIDDRGDSTLSYPTKADGYVPQAYRLVRYDNPDTRLERDVAWHGISVANDVGPCVLRHLESPYSLKAPLLVLGHPGSGKSLLTEMIAGALAYPQYTTVRVPLRDVNPDLDLQAQIEAQIRRTTGRTVNWVDFVGNQPLSPPVVILDGYDELLQATGQLFTGYLEEVARFQHEQARQDRPVRVIVTSRLTLIDKAVVPLGSTVLRLEDFDNHRCRAWTEVWNRHNVAYFQRTGTPPFQLPGNESVLELTRQPLLLLMLAVYDSDGGALSARSNFDQTLLYDELLRRFIVRELSKGAAGADFRRLDSRDRGAMIDREMIRLGVAAISMVNRKESKILRDQLNGDLFYFAVERGDLSDGKRKLSQADALFGSFFFIHESRSRLDQETTAHGAEAEARADGGAALEGSGTSGPAAFEFLHKTFAEFLAADFILRTALAEANAICALAALPPDAGLGDMLGKRLMEPRSSWYACLVYTALHTQPNTLKLMRQWAVHRLAAAPRSADELLRSLDLLVHAQLRGLLTGITLPDLSVRGPDGSEAPYPRLPLLGHVAVYSLNLILLRCYLADAQYTLAEADLGQVADGPSPWDLLTGLWRSWFPRSILGALPDVFNATREGSALVLEPSRSALFVPASSNLAVAHNVDIALADNQAAASTGVHLLSYHGHLGYPHELLHERIGTGVPEFLPVAESLQARIRQL